MNSHNPFNTGGSGCTNDFRSADQLVDRIIGDAYHVVKEVYLALGNLSYIYNYLQKYGLIITVDSEDAIKDIPLSIGKFARVYNKSDAAGYYFTDYLYVADDTTGILPNDPTATGSWISTKSTGSNASFVRIWKYRAVADGETVIQLPTDMPIVGVQTIYVQGSRQDLNEGFEFNQENSTITLADSLDAGNLVTVIIGITDPDMDIDIFAILKNSDGASNIGTLAGITVEEALNYSNANTYEQWRRQLADVGVTLVSGSFEKGAQITSDTEAVWSEANAQCYTWQGILPKTIPAKSTPETTGGIGAGAWKDVSGLQLRKTLALDSAMSGAYLIAAPTGGTVRDHLWNSTTIEAFLEQANGNVDDALDLAVAYCIANNCKIIQLASGKSYPLYREHIWNTNKNIAFIGDRQGRQQQGSGYSDGGTAAERAATPKDAAFLWMGDTGKTWFSCGSQFTFDGIVFGAPNQNWSATTKADIIDYGTAITAISNLNVRSCIYYGMKNFIVATGGSHNYENNSGFAMERDYQISNARDINRIKSCHANPNVIRPNQAMWRCLIDDTRTMITLNNHDGTMISDCHTFCFKKAVVNVNASNYLGTLFLSRLHLDQTGCVLDNNSAGDGALFLTDIDCIGDNASNAGSTTADSDAGYLILRKTTNSLITPVYLSGCNFQAASSLVTSKPPVMINFQTASGYAVHMVNVHCPEPTDNGAGTSCQMTGFISNSTRNYSSDPIRENLIPNPGWAGRHPTNNTPLGWFFTNCSVSATVGRSVTSSAAGAVFGINFRQIIGSRTYIFTATSIGSSTGVKVVATDANNVTTTYTGAWIKRGNKYHCVITATTVDTYHSIEINVGDSGNAVAFEYAAMVAGSQFNYAGSYSERLQKPTTTGISSYSVQVGTNGSHTIYPGYAGLAGAYHLYISSAIGTIVCRLVKLNPTAVPKITVEDSAYAGTDTFTVTWPDNSNPVIASMGAGVLFLTLTGATYTSAY